MSKLARKLIDVKNVQISQEGSFLKISGKEGNISMDLHPSVFIVINDNLLKVNGDDKALLGTFFRIIEGSVKGVQSKFQKKIIVNGIGYKVLKEGDSLRLSIGFEKDVTVKIPVEVEVEVKKENDLSIILKSVSKQKIGNFAAILCKQRKYCPYKQTGIYEAGKFRIVKKRKA